jgi:hypothetical protein
MALIPLQGHLDIGDDEDQVIEGRDSGHAPI